MSMLFDVGREEPVRRKKVEEPQAEPMTLPAKATPILGALDADVTCPCCDSQCHDIVDEGKTHWLVQCCFCGTGQWVKAIKGHLRQEGEFRLRGGRFNGLTMAQVVKQPRGLDYVRWAAVEHPRPAVREAAKAWLAENQASG